MNKEYKHPLYNIWHGMKNRCYNVKHDSYKYYGARGVTICDRWLRSFSNFVEDMGSRPSKDFQIDRIDNNGNYEPSNCRWASRSANAHNRSTSWGIQVDYEKWNDIMSKIEIL